MCSRTLFLFSEINSSTQKGTWLNEMMGMAAGAFLVLVGARRALAGWCADFDHPDDCAGLSELAQATGWKHWRDNDNWGTDTTVCKWYGVTCNDTVTAHGAAAAPRHRPKRVTALKLKENGLVSIQSIPGSPLL